MRKADPETQVSLKIIRRLIHTGAVPSVPVGNGNRRLVNLDALINYLERPPEGKPEQAQGIRRINERRVV